MKVINEPDYPSTDAACLSATGRDMPAWFEYLDRINGLKIGRREATSQMLDDAKLGRETESVWWVTTVYVEYEKARDVRKKDQLFEGYMICCTKNISAPVEKVYATWTDPALFAEMFGDEAKQTVEEGGGFECKSGCKGKFTRVRPNKDLRFTWTHPGATSETLVDVMFQDAKGKCLMNVMTSRIQTRGEADGLRRAWADALARLKSLAEQ
jgi:uncharacterized protein YndB with AHSA1/START domain